LLWGYSVCSLLGFRKMVALATSMAVGGRRVSAKWWRSLLQWLLAVVDMLCDARREGYVNPKFQKEHRPRRISSEGAARDKDGTSRAMIWFASTEPWRGKGIGANSCGSATSLIRYTTSPRPRDMFAHSEWLNRPTSTTRYIVR
jgi:hypothetical protein